MKSYAPKVFRRIRDFFGIDAAGYMLSICGMLFEIQWSLSYCTNPPIPLPYNKGNYNYLEFISNSKGGQFFFYSHDGRYMIKTQTTAENRFLKRILPHYYKYITENPHTLLVRFFGMHRSVMCNCIYYLLYLIFLPPMISFLFTYNKSFDLYNIMTVTY